MERSGAGGKVLVALTVLGAVAIVVAIALFSLTGSRVGADLLLFTGGFVLGMVAVTLLTRSPRRGRLVAAVVLLVFLVGGLALVLARPDWLVAFVAHEPGWARSSPTSLVRWRGYPCCDCSASTCWDRAGIKRRAGECRKARCSGGCRSG